jgi:hypothetical protein
MNVKNSLPYVTGQNVTPISLIITLKINVSEHDRVAIFMALCWRLQNWVSFQAKLENFPIFKNLGLID